MLKPCFESLDLAGTWGTQSCKNQNKCLWSTCRSANSKAWLVDEERRSGGPLPSFGWNLMMTVMANTTFCMLQALPLFPNSVQISPAFRLSWPNWVFVTAIGGLVLCPVKTTLWPCGVFFISYFQFSSWWLQMINQPWVTENCRVH